MVTPSHLCQLIPVILTGLNGISATAIAIDHVANIKSAITQCKMMAIEVYLTLFISRATAW